MSSSLGFTTTEREYEMNKKLLCAVGLTVASFVAPSAVFAGETTGGPDPKPTGMRGHASSRCGFSGLEEVASFEGDPANVKPGRLTQTPHYQMTGTGPVYAPPGTPGEACNPSNP